MALIKLDTVSKYYKNADSVSVGMRKVSLTFDIGELVVITGESGSGKSTLLNVISGLDSYEDGEMYLFNEETSHYTIKDWENYRSKYIGFIFQNYNIIDSYTVYQNVVLALEIQNYPRRERRKRALELIEQVGLSSHKHHKASKLSGGQKQRCVIARALAKDSPIIVADEPTGNLDSESGKNVIELLHQIAKDKLIVVVTHDFEQIERYATRKIKMHDGEVVEDKTLIKTEKQENPVIPSKKHMTFPTVMLFALRNMFATPRRLLFFILLQVAILFSFTFIYSTLMYSLRATDLGGGGLLPVGESYFDDFAINRMPDTRLVVLRKDGDVFTSNDISYLNSLSNQAIFEPNITKLDDDNLSHLTYTNTYGYEIPYYSFATDITHFLELNMSGLFVNGEFPNAANEVLVSNYYSDIDTDHPLELRDVGSNVIGTFTVTGIINDGNSGRIYFHSSYYDENGIGDVMTIFADDAQTAVEIKNSVDPTRFRIVYPADDEGMLGGIFSPILYILSILYYTLAFIVALFLFMILHAVFKNVMHARKKDFAVYRAIGANQSKLGILVIVEQIFMMIMSIIINFVIISLIVQSDYFYQMVFREITFNDYLIMFATFIFFSVWLGLRFNRRIFRFTIIENLSYSKEEMA